MLAHDLYFYGLHCKLFSDKTNEMKRNITENFKFNNEL